MDNDNSNSLVGRCYQENASTLCLTAAIVMATTARGGAADTSSQQRCLRIGDTILLYVRDRRGYVYSELSGSATQTP